MATVIDELVVRLGLDSKGFSRGAKKVDEELERTKKTAAKTSKDVEASGKRAAEFFGQMEKAAVKFLAVFTLGSGFQDFTRYVIQGGAQLARMSQNLGVSTDKLSRWAGAVRVSGGSTEAFLGTMQGLSQALTELKLTGNTGILPYLQALKVSVADVNGKAKPLDVLLGDIGESLRALPNRQDAFNIGRNLGIDEGTINLLLKGRAEVNRLLADQKAYSDKDAKAALEASERWEEARLKIERMAQVLVIKAIPALERFTEKMERLADVSVPILETIYEWIEKIDLITGGWAKKLDDIMPKFSNPTMQKLFGGKAEILLKGNPITTLAGAATAAANEAAKYDTDNVLGRTKNKILSYFGFEPEPASSAPATEAAAGQSAEQGGPLTRAQRNNNPGNLEFRGQAGAVPEEGEGRFAKFKTMAEGAGALVRQLQLYGQRGINTLDKIINTYAPDKENDTAAYIAHLSKLLGVGANQQLDLNDANTLAGLVRGISQHESGKSVLTDQDVLTGLQLAGVRGGGGAGNNISIGQVTINTQATDATGIARDFNTALIRQADSGMR